MKFNIIIDMPAIDNGIGRIVNLPDGRLIHSQGANAIISKSTQPSFPDYDSLEWNVTDPILPRDDVSSWGVKTFPGKGAFCFVNYVTGESEVVLAVQ